MAGLSARSIVASTLLGTHPPELPGRLLVAFAAEFGVDTGATRVALTRMVGHGELERVDGGRYRLAGDLLARQERQELGLGGPERPWTGDWEQAVVRSGRRSPKDRASLRRAAEHLGLGELRDGVWLRPANLDPGRLPGDRAVLAAQADLLVARPVEQPAELVARVFDLQPWHERAAELVAAMDGGTAALERGDDGALVDGFVLAASVVRHLVADPRIPEELEPAGWGARHLRAVYADYVKAVQAGLSAFFRDLAD